MSATTSPPPAPPDCPYQIKGQALNGANAVICTMAEGGCPLQQMRPMTGGRHVAFCLRPAAPGGPGAFRSVLVPLDGSPFAEQALPLALAIARRAGARLDLVEAHGLYFKENPHSCWVPRGHDLDADLRRREATYLRAVAERAAGAPPLTVTAGVLPGSPALPERVAESIIERALAVRAGLIVTTTHAPGPLTRLALGSVADELVRRSGVPVILVRPGPTPPGPALDDILVPLDGSPLAEQVLAPATALAQAMGARCRLLQVVSPDTPGGAAAAEAYLAGAAGGLRRLGVQALTRAVLADDAVGAILKEAEERGSDLIALATHGRGGLERLVLGSVADQLIRRARTPVLVYRPPATPDSPRKD